MKNLMRNILLVPALIFASASAANALPPAVEAAKDGCVVGERIDGYLGYIDERQASDSLKRMIRDINQKRAAAYTNIAEKNGVTPAIAAAATAEELINSSPSGHCVQNEQGEWFKKP